jgi:Flp pilus assembly protein TadG
MSHKSSRGQALVEFALVLPILVGMLMGFFDLGRVVLANDLISSAANEATRFAIVHGGSRSTACPVGPPDPIYTVIPPASDSCPYPSPSKEAIREVARDFAAAGGGISVTVEVCYGAGCSGDTDVPNATNVRGTPVTVTVHAGVPMVAASFVGLAHFDLTSTSTMLVNH